MIEKQAADCNMSRGPSGASDGALRGSAPDQPWFRLAVIAGLVATILVTWPLWNVRVAPPLLPALALPQLSLGVPLLAGSLLAVVVPRAGAIAVTGLIAYGMLTDQTRMQPEFFSFPILLWGTLPSPSLRLIARVHLIALWFYAGLHKLLSVDYRAHAGPRLLAELPNAVPQGLLAIAAIGVALVEVGTAILAIVPELRRYAAWSALALHAGIILAFVPLGAGRNVAVWPWNVVLACSGFALISSWQGALSADVVRAPVLPRAIALLLLVAPAGYYAGVVDAYPAHNLYASGTSSATVYCPSGCGPEQDINATWHALNVPLPPQPRLFTATFNRTCKAGDVLRIADPHPPPWADAAARRVHFCPVGSLPASHS